MSPARNTRRWLAMGILAAAAWLATTGVCSASAPRLRVVGNDLVDARSGAVFVPRGVNWPSFEYACSDGYGFSNSASAETVGPTAAGAAVIASWHVNTVRIPLNQDCWLGEDGLPRFGTALRYRAAVVRWVSTLHRAGIAVILDLHWSGPAGVVSDGQRAMPDDRSDNFWRSVARAFKADRSVMFDVFNEPYTRYGPTEPIFELTWGCWLSGGCNPPLAQIRQAPDGRTFVAIGMQALIDAIRRTGARQPIIVSGRDFANDVSGWIASRPSDGQLVAGFHNYNHQLCNTRDCWNGTVARVALRVPVVTGEFGEDDCSPSFVNDFMDWADRRRIGYLAWAWWILPVSPCSDHVLLGDVRGTPRAPNGTALKAHLAGLAPRLTLGGSRTQALRSVVEIGARCNKSCSVRVTGRLLVERRTGPAGVTGLRQVARRLPARRMRTLALEIPPARRAAVSAALLQRRSVRASVTVVATAHSLESSRTRVVRVRAP